MLVLVLHSSRNLVTGQFFYFKKKKNWSVLELRFLEMPWWYCRNVLQLLQVRSSRKEDMSGSSRKEDLSGSSIKYEPLMVARYPSVS